MKLDKNTLEEILEHNDTSLITITVADAAEFMLERDEEPESEEFWEFCNQLKNGGLYYYLNENLYMLMEADWDYAKEKIAKKS